MKFHYTFYLSSQIVTEIKYYNQFFEYYLGNCHDTGLVGGKPLKHYLLDDMVVILDSSILQRMRGQYTVEDVIRIYSINRMDSIRPVIPDVWADVVGGTDKAVELTKKGIQKYIKNGIDAFYFVSHARNYKEELKWYELFKEYRSYVIGFMPHTGIKENITWNVNKDLPDMLHHVAQIVIYMEEGIDSFHILGYGNHKNLALIPPLIKRLNVRELTADSRTNHIFATLRRYLTWDMVWIDLTSDNLEREAYLLCSCPYCLNMKKNGINAIDIYGHNNIRYRELFHYYNLLYQLNKDCKYSQYWAIIDEFLDRVEKHGGWEVLKKLDEEKKGGRLDGFVRW